MTRRIFIHAGLPKTSTTAIQSALSVNRDKLLSEHILYPSISDNHTTPLCTMFLEDPSNLISNKIAGYDTKQKCQPQRQHYKKQLIQDIKSKPWQTLLFSAEGLSNMAVPDLMKLKSWCETLSTDIKINIWIRDPVSYTTSVMQQLLKGGDILEDLFKDPPLPNYQGPSRTLSVFLGATILYLIFTRPPAIILAGLSALFLKMSG